MGGGCGHAPPCRQLTRCQRGSTSRLTPRCAARAPRHASRCRRPFHVTTTTETSGTVTRVVRPSARRFAALAKHVWYTSIVARAVRAQVNNAGAGHPAGSQLAAQLLVGGHADHRLRPATVVIGIEQNRRVARQLRNRRRPRGDDRGAAGHGFEDRETEAFVARRIDERRCGSVKGVQHAPRRLVRGGRPPPAPRRRPPASTARRPFRGRCPPAPATSPAARQNAGAPRARRDRRPQIAPLVQIADVKQEGSGHRGGQLARRTLSGDANAPDDPERHDRQALGSDRVHVRDLRRRKPRAGQDVVGRAGAPPVKGTTEPVAAIRIPLRITFVADVVDGQHDRCWRPEWGGVGRGVNHIDPGFRGGARKAD